MGYYTKFKITVYRVDTISEEEGPLYIKNDIHAFPELLESLKKISGFELPIFKYEHKWYDYKNHMSILSKEFPSSLFIVEGEGEASGDVWIKIFQNGNYIELKPGFQDD